jgi:hypothetical protein
MLCAQKGKVQEDWSKIGSIDWFKAIYVWALRAPMDRHRFSSIVVQTTFAHLYFVLP